MSRSKCNDCNNMIKAEKNGEDYEPSIWACTHPLRDPISCYTGMMNGVLGYQTEDCPDQDPGHCHSFSYTKEESAELKVLSDEYGEYGDEHLKRGVEIALEKYI